MGGGGLEAGPYETLFFDRQVLVIITIIDLWDDACPDAGVVEFDGDTVEFTLGLTTDQGYRTHGDGCNQSDEDGVPNEACTDLVLERDRAKRTGDSPRSHVVRAIFRSHGEVSA